jgi:hypothetical protein
MKRIEIKDLAGKQYMFIREFNGIPIGSILGVNPIGQMITFNGGLCDTTSQNVFTSLILNEVNGEFDYLKEINQIYNKV